jgi:hypothetical protein
MGLSDYRKRKFIYPFLVNRPRYGAECPDKVHLVLVCCPAILWAAIPDLGPVQGARMVWQGAPDAPRRGRRRWTRSRQHMRVAAPNR